jgi:hypothetical protein
MTNKNLMGSVYLDKIINNYDIILGEQAEECKYLLGIFLNYSTSDKEVENLSINIDKISKTLKIVLNLAIEKEIVTRKMNITEGEIK